MLLSQINFFPLQKLIYIKLRVNVILILVEQWHEEHNSAR